MKLLPAIAPASIAVLASLPALTSAYWRQGCSRVQTGRIDPILSPGGVANHVHLLVGNPNVGVSSTGAQLSQAGCSSCGPQADLSAYWTPQLYYQHANGMFEEVPATGSLIYYLGRGENRSNIIPFPPGFRMLSGDMTARSYNNQTYTFGGTQGVSYVGGTCANGVCQGGSFVNGTAPNAPFYTGRPLGDRVSFACLSSTPGTFETPGFTRFDCDYGLRAQVQFPSCWNGVDLYKPDQSHVAYMSQIDNGICPPTHPYQFVHLFYETLYGVTNIQTDGGQFVFAYGDPTGFGFHGDFMNGWDQDVLTNALNQCANVDNGGDLTLCAPLNATNDPNSNYNCPERAPLINENARGMLSSLPGCNGVNAGPGPVAPISCSSQPSINNIPSITGVMTSPSIGAMTGNWSYVGCATDSTSSRALQGASTSSSSMTVEQCMSFCSAAGYQLAGVEYGAECYCDNSLQGGATMSNTCNSMVCAGELFSSSPSNSSIREVCGGPSRLSLYNNTAYVPPPSVPAVGTQIGNWTYNGCASEANGQRALSLASFTSSTIMNADSCTSYCASRGYTLAGTEYSRECYCGNSLNSGSQYNQTGCTMQCTGSLNSTSPFAAYANICGGPNRLSVYGWAPQPNAGPPPVNNDASKGKTSSTSKALTSSSKAPTSTSSKAATMTTSVKTTSTSKKVTSTPTPTPTPKVTSTSKKATTPTTSSKK